MQDKCSEIYFQRHRGNHSEKKWSIAEIHRVIQVKDQKLFFNHRKCKYLLSLCSCLDRGTSLENLWDCSTRKCIANRKQSDGVFELRIGKLRRLETVNTLVNFSFLSVLCFGSVDVSIISQRTLILGSVQLALVRRFWRSALSDASFSSRTAEW